MNICFDLRLALNTLCVLSLGATLTTAAEPASSAIDSPVQQASEFVTAALQAEAEGDFLARQRLLQSAENCDKKRADLKWQRGYVRVNDTLQSVEAFVEEVCDYK